MSTGDLPTGADSGWPQELNDEYEFRGELGRGGMAVVYRARERSLGREVAIKVVRPRFHADEESVARLAREARTVAQLEHPNIVSLHAIKRLQNGLALIMQLVPGRTLKAALASGPLAPEVAGHVLRDIAGALAYAHRSGVVHRDVKPENIFLDEATGRAVLSDFGVARSIMESTDLTATGTAIGTPTYMSPEQIDGGHLDGRSDLYSLGMVGWEMLSGQRPWAGESLYSVIYRQKHDELPPLDLLRPDVPPRLQHLIEGLMHKNPERRWASAARFLSLLASEEPAPGFKEWQALARKRRKAAVLPRAGVAAGAGIPTSMSTVRFRRDEDTDPSLSPDELQAIALGDAEATQRIASGPHESVEQENEPLAPRRRRLPFVVGATVAAFAATAFALMTPGFGTEPSAPPPQAIFSDGPALQVPVLPPADSIAAAGEFALDSSRYGASLADGATTTRDSVAAASAPVTVPPTGADSTRRLADAMRSAPSTRPPPAPLPATTDATSPRSSPSAPAREAPLAAPPAAVPLASARESLPAVGRSPGAPVTFSPDRALIAAGGRHSCMLDDAGRALCWGNNERGQVGDGGFEVQSAPVAVIGSLAFSAVSAGGWHTCGVARDGDALCWGSNDAGQLGDGTTAARAAPVRVTGGAAYRLVRAGQSHTCALTRGGGVHCWGSNAKGQIGDGTRATRTAPAAVSLGTGAGALAVGRAHSCALAIDGTAWCWGENGAGQLGDGSTTDRASPVPVATDRRFVAIAAGIQHTCAVATDGDAWCWGKNSYGQLGTGAPSGGSPAPQRVEGGRDYATITAGQVHTCARTRDGRAFCWGRNSYGQLGDGTSVDRARPVAVRSPAPFSALNASGAHTCGLTTGGEGFCWGYNIDGQLGAGDRENASTPARVSSVPR